MKKADTHSHEAGRGARGRVLQQRQQSREKSNANLRSSKGQDNQGPRPSTLKPKPTDVNVKLYAQLTSAGLSPTDALSYLAPEYHKSLSTKPLREWVNEWASRPAVVQAIDDSNGGPWHELNPDERVEKAIAHHIAQQARLLYTSDISDPDAELGKIRDARAVLQEYVKDRSGSGTGKFEKAIRDMLEGRLHSGPPQMPVKEGEVKH